MRTHTNRGTELNTSSVADIAFLLLVFFMVTTVINDEKGLPILLPAYNNPTAPLHERNVFTIQINSADQYLVEGEPRPSLDGVRGEIKAFILNNGAIQQLSESPSKAVVSLKTDRGTSYGVYICALDEIQAAYYDIYAERAGISAAQFRRLDLYNAHDHYLYNKGREGIPMNISIAEPNSVGN